MVVPKLTVTQSSIESRRVGISRSIFFVVYDDFSFYHQFSVLANLTNFTLIAVRFRFLIEIPVMNNSSY